MSKSGSPLPLSQLRDAFDRNFASKVELARDEYDEVLAIRVQDKHVALRVRDIAGIQRCPQLTTVPSRHPALCGVAGLRGSVVAVYSLAALLRDERASSGGGWIVRSAADPSVALHFDELEGYERVAAERILASQSPTSEEASSVQLVAMGGGHLVLLALEELLKIINLPLGSAKE